MAHEYRRRREKVKLSAQDRPDAPARRARGGREEEAEPEEIEDREAQDAVIATRKEQTMTVPEHLKTPADLLAEGRRWVLHPGQDEDGVFRAEVVFADHPF
jgi:hypothetical protein